MRGVPSCTRSESFRILDAVVGLEDDPYGVTRLLWEAGLQQVVGGDGVRAGELGAVGISAIQRLAQEAEGEEGDDPENENETAAVEAPAGESFEHREASFVLGGDNESETALRRTTHRRRYER